MSNSQHTIPRVAIQSIASGAFMMAFFTMMWALIAHFALAGKDYNIEIIIFAILAIAFITNGIYLFTIAKRFPKLSEEADIAEGKRSGKWFGIIFGAEGLGIFIAINIVRLLGHDDLVIPVIALVVGLHFYPLGWVFKRTLDYYLATWATLTAILGIVFTLNKTYPENNILAFVGIGLAIATSSYGLYMMYEGRRLSKLPKAADYIVNAALTK
jgi:hypothetical protein